MLVKVVKRHFLILAYYHKRIHTGEKPSAHLQRKKNTNIDSSLIRNTDCGETIKIEDIKGEINEEESFEDPLSIHEETEYSNICEDIKEEVKEEENDEVPSFNQQELGKV